MVEQSGLVFGNTNSNRLYQKVTRIIGSRFSNDEVKRLCSALDDQVKTDILMLELSQPIYLPQSLGRPIMHALLDTGVFKDHFMNERMRDEFDSDTVETIDELRIKLRQ